MNASFLRDVREGLSQQAKSLAPKWLYDERGSELFEAITKTADYYLTRTEAEIMRTAYGELPAHVPPGCAIAEFGSGAGIKSRRLIEALKPSVYVSIDVAEEFLTASCEKLSRMFPDTDVQGVLADFSGQVALPESFFAAPQRMGFFPGSTIGNFAKGGAETFLAKSRESLGDGSMFLIGADLVKDEDVLLAAYDDSDGITRLFTKNLLVRMKHELDAELDLDGFEAVALWNPTEARLELGVVAQGPQTIRLGSDVFPLENGEMIHTENSHKFTPDSFSALGERAGWKVRTHWTDSQGWFGVFLLEAA
ncbi:MAG: L-histidine N(alpha)-methyltransferase [Pseudomonadota bacterium]